MEMGIGFLVGALAGVAVALIVAVVIAIARKAARKNKTRLTDREDYEDDTAVLDRKGAISERRRSGSSTRAGSKATTVRPASGNTIVLGKVPPQEVLLNKNLQEVRELLLQLADVISSTENASGEATVAFNSARDTIGNIQSDASPELAEAQLILLGEIDRVLRSNAKLHSELDKANQGIAEQRRQIEELRLQARIDALTKIPNRAAFNERMDEYVGLVARAKIAFSLLILDIDHFKQVNDDHGHLNGDRILRGVAARISSSIRTNDFAARYGGEEFAVILPATDLQEAAAVSERVRQDIARTNFRMDDKNVKMTISGGLAECGNGMSAEDVIAAADEALYQAKSTGRNRIVVKKNNA